MGGDELVEERPGGVVEEEGEVGRTSLDVATDQVRRRLDGRENGLVRPAGEVAAAQRRWVATFVATGVTSTPCERTSIV